MKNCFLAAGRGRGRGPQPQMGVGPAAEGRPENNTCALSGPPLFWPNRDGTANESCKPIGRPRWESVDGDIPSGERRERRGRPERFRARKASDRAGECDLRTAIDCPEIGRELVINKHAVSERTARLRRTLRVFVVRDERQEALFPQQTHTNPSEQERGFYNESLGRPFPKHPCPEERFSLPLCDILPLRHKPSVDIVWDLSRSSSASMSSLKDDIRPPQKAQQQMLFIWRIRRSDDPSSRHSHSYAAPPLPHLFIDALESKATLSKMRISMMWRERSGKSALQYSLSLSLSHLLRKRIFCCSVCLYVICIRPFCIQRAEGQQEQTRPAAAAHCAFPQSLHQSRRSPRPPAACRPPLLPAIKDVFALLRRQRKTPIFGTSLFTTSLILSTGISHQAVY